MYVNVALNIPADKLFTYEVPDNLQSKAHNRQKGFCSLWPSENARDLLSPCRLPAILQDVKPVSEILDEEPLFDANDLKFYEWIADYFHLSPGENTGRTDSLGIRKEGFPMGYPRARSRRYNAHARAEKNYWTSSMQHPQRTFVE